MPEINQIILKCKKGNAKAQRELYEMYSPVLYGICIRYVADSSEAKDILQESFIKILTKIDKYSGKGSFEGWMKRITVNTAITHYHKSKKHNHHLEVSEIQDFIETNPEYHSDFTQDELLKVIETLPNGYRMVFNLYAIEGFKHKEIAEQLKIDVNTSKSQYSRAKKIIQGKLKQLEKINLHEEQ